MSGSEHNWDDIPSLNLEMDEDYDNRLQAKEVRRHTRIDTSVLQDLLSTNITVIPIRIATGGHGVFDGVIVDLSQSGVKLTSPKKVAKDEKVRVGFKIKERTIISKAVVRWTCSNDMYSTVGIEFLDLSTNDEEFLGALATASMLNKTGSFKI